MTKSQSLESVGYEELADFPEHNQALQAFETYFGGKWLTDHCQGCDSDYFKKPAQANDSCGAFDCVGTYQFLEAKPPRNNYLSGLQIGNQFQDFFTHRGFEPVAPIAIAGHQGAQVFTGTAGQIFDGPIFHETAYDDTKYFVAQPVIRMQKSEHDGF